MALIGKRVVAESSLTFVQACCKRGSCDLRSAATVAQSTLGVPATILPVRRYSGSPLRSLTSPPASGDYQGARGYV